MLNHNISMVVYQTLRNNAHRAHEAAIGMANIRDNKVRDEQIELSGIVFVFLVFQSVFHDFDMDGGWPTSATTRCGESTWDLFQSW